MSVGLELAKFDMRSISFRPDENKGPVIVLIGRRDTGKSFLVKDLMYYHQDIPIGTVISGTEAGNGFFGEHVPKLFIHDAYNTAIIENILKRQKAVLKQMKKEIELYKRSTIDPRTFVVLDDCLFDNKWTKDVMMRLLFMNGRHWKVMLVITMQYPLGIPPICERILIMFLFYVNHILEIVKESMRTMLVCFQHLKVFVKLWTSVLKTSNVW